jgi:hypothetical protein
VLLCFSNVDSLDDPSPPPTADDIPVDAADAQVSLDALYRVLHHGESANSIYQITSKHQRCSDISSSNE